MMETAAAVVKALRATEKRRAKSLSKNKKMNDSSTKKEYYENSKFDFGDVGIDYDWR